MSETNETQSGERRKDQSQHTSGEKQEETHEEKGEVNCKGNIEANSVQ